MFQGVNFIIMVNFLNYYLKILSLYFQRGTFFWKQNKLTNFHLGNLFLLLQNGTLWKMIKREDGWWEKRKKGERGERERFEFASAVGQAESSVSRKERSLRATVVFPLFHGFISRVPLAGTVEGWGCKKSTTKIFFSKYIGERFRIFIYCSWWESVINTGYKNVTPPFIFLVPHIVKFLSLCGDIENDCLKKLFFQWLIFLLELQR